MKVKIYTNDGRGHFLGFKEQSEEERELTMVHSFDITEEEVAILRGKDFVNFVLEFVYQETNIGKQSPLARAWRGKMLRSLSIGDCVVVGEVAYTVARFGWERITTEELEKAVIWNDETETVSP